MAQVAAHEAVPTRQPTNKVVGATVGSGVGTAVGTIVNWLLNTYVFTPHMPDNVQSAITVLITAGLTFYGGWILRPSGGETVISDNGKHVTAKRVV